MRPATPTKILTLGALMALILAGCATATLTRSGALSSYEGMTPANGTVTKSLVRADKAALAKARTVQLMPITFLDAKAGAGLSEADRSAIANALNRALCRDLSRRFTIAAAGEPADLTVTGAITAVIPTNTTAATGSSVLRIVPLPLPRIPVGLGGLSAEAEAQDAGGRQVAALVWARGADAITTRARMSAGGDAYELASSFSADFATLLRYGSATAPTTVETIVPSGADLTYSMTGTPSAACARFGKGPSLTGTVSGIFGAPPDWTEQKPNPKP
jgi:hypothetical protein